MAGKGLVEVELSAEQVRGLGLPGSMAPGVRMRGTLYGADGAGLNWPDLTMVRVPPVLERPLGKEKVRFAPEDRAFPAALLRHLPMDVLWRLRLLVRPDTILQWHRDLHKKCHAAASSPKGPGRPRTVRSIRAPGAAPGSREQHLGLPAHPRRTTGPGHRGRPLHRLGDPA